MESGSPRDMSRLISELTLGKDLTRQLETQMEQSYSSPSEQCKHLVQSLLSTWDKAISIAKSSSESDGERCGMGMAPSAGADSPNSLSGSPRSEGSDRALKDQESREMGKKRKTLPQWTRRVNMCPGTGLEGPLDDGFSWRKYGQKDILGAKHPRGYYRCTHRHSQGCPATKQVQRSDENPAVFDVTYRGQHTCVQRANSAPEASIAAAAAAEQQQQVPAQLLLPTPGDAAGKPLLPCFRTALTVKTEGLDGGGPFPSSSSSSFSFLPSPAAAALDSPFTGSFSPPFISPRAASQSNCFTASSSPVGGFSGGQQLPAPESGLADLLYGAASNADSAAVDLGFMLDHVESDPNYPFGSSFFP